MTILKRWDNARRRLAEKLPTPIGVALGTTLFFGSVVGITAGPSVIDNLYLKPHTPLHEQVDSLSNYRQTITFQHDDLVRNPELAKQSIDSVVTSYQNNQALTDSIMTSEATAEIYDLEEVQIREYQESKIYRNGIMVALGLGFYLLGYNTGIFTIYSLVSSQKAKEKN